MRIFRPAGPFSHKVAAIVAATLAVSAGLLLNPGTASAATLTPLNVTSFSTAATPVNQWMLPTSTVSNSACLTDGPAAGTTSIPGCSPTTDVSNGGALRLTTNGSTPKWVGRLWSGPDATSVRLRV